MLNKHNLEIADFCSQYESRYILEGIYVSPEKTSATDGRILVEITTPKENLEDNEPKVKGCEFTRDFKPFMMPAKLAKEICRSIPTDSQTSGFSFMRYAHVDQSSDPDPEKEIKIGTLNRESNRIFQFKSLSGTYPDTKSAIWDPADETFAITVNPELMLKAMQMFNRFLRKWNMKSITMRFKKSNNAIRIEAKNLETEQTAVCMVMPMKDERTEKYAG